MMSKVTERTFGILPAPHWHRPFLRYIADTGDGVIVDQEQQTTESTESNDTVDAGEPEVDWKAKSREWERRAKENKTAAEELQKLRDAQKTDEEKRAERLAALETENASLKAEKQIAEWKAEIAETTGVPAAALRGATREDLEAHAKEIQTLIPKKPTPKSPALERVNQSDGVQVTTSPGLGTLRAAYAESDK